MRCCRIWRSTRIIAIRVREEGGVDREGKGQYIDVCMMMYYGVYMMMYDEYIGVYMMIHDDT